MKDDLDRWVDEDATLDDAGDSALASLLRAARRARPAMSDIEAAQVLDGVRVDARNRRRRLWGTRGARWMAGMAAGMTLMALRSPAPPPREDAAAVVERVVVKHFLIESIQDGRVSHLEMTLHRTQKKERSHVSSPPL